MKDRIIAAVITAIVHNKKSSAAALVAVLGIFAARLGLKVDADTLVYIATFIILVIGLAAGDAHNKRSFPRRGMFASRKGGAG